MEKEVSAPNQDNSYSTILKRISSFGGVQIFNVLLTLIRGKFVALFLGSEGMGFSSMYTSATGTIQQIATLGLNLSLVKEVASTKGKDTYGHVITTGLRLILFTSLLGAVICMALSPLLSKWSFGNYDYTFSFLALSAGVFLSIGGTGYLALLQGAGEIKRLSKSSIVGGSAGLVFGVPLYYFFGIKGIVPAIIILSLSTFLFYYFSFKSCVTHEPVKFSWPSHKPIVKKLISLGLILMIGSLVGTLTNYLINIFIREFGSVSDIGLFQAGNSIANQYVGVVFSAIALDYFPRLSAVADDKEKLLKAVNNQLEIVMLIITPLVIILFLTAPWIIKILLTEEFLVITPMLRWMGLGILFQIFSFPLDYLILVKENKKMYVWLDVVLINILWIACSVIFYYLFGLTGLGISVAARSVIVIPVIYGICHRLYGFRLEKKSLLILFCCYIMGAGGFLVSFLPPHLFFIWLPVILLVSLGFSVYYLYFGIKGSISVNR